MELDGCPSNDVLLLLADWIVEDPHIAALTDWPTLVELATRAWARSDGAAAILLTACPDLTLGEARTLTSYLRRPPVFQCLPSVASAKS